jgi:ferritin-like metal-binding protein YciE
MDQETLKELLMDVVRDIYDAEKQIVRALPKMIKAASNEDLQQALQDHLDETKEQVTRIEQVFQVMGEQPKSKPCKGMRGLLEEGSEVLQEEEEGVLLDLAMIAAAQKVEHYEISAYGTARTIAEQLGKSKAVQLLQRTEEEEKNADSKLSQVAAELYGSEEESEPEDEEMETAGAGSGRSGAKRASGGRGSSSSRQRR